MATGLEDVIRRVTAEFKLAKEKEEYFAKRGHKRMMEKWAWRSFALGQVLVLLTGEEEKT